MRVVSESKTGNPHVEVRSNTTPKVTYGQGVGVIETRLLERAYAMGEALTVNNVTKTEDNSVKTVAAIESSDTIELLQQIASNTRETADNTKKFSIPSDAGNETTTISSSNLPATSSAGNDYGRDQAYSIAAGRIN